jgi:hypothetical protein
MRLGFRGRPRLLQGARRLLMDLCTEYLEPTEPTHLLLTAAQELLENVVKYSSDDGSTLDFALAITEGRPMATIGTRNAASALHLEEAERLLHRIVSAPDPCQLYDSMLATSGDRPGSGLGLVRIRAEAGLLLSYSIQEGHLNIVASGTVQPRLKEA